MTPRRQELENFQCDLKKLNEFLGECGQDKPITIIDPDQSQEMNRLAVAVESSLDWISAEIKVELKAENDSLPSEGIRTGVLIGG
jgi:hypothetical protein